MMAIQTLTLVFSLLISVSFSLSVSLKQPCSTPACHQVAQFVLDSIDTTADPCSNFYQYACGNWPKKHPLPPSEAFYTVSNVLDDQISREIIEALEGSRNASGVKVSNSVKFAAYLYEQCLALGTQNDSVGLEQLKTLVQSILGHEWAIGQPLANPHLVVPWPQDYVSAYLAGVHALFKLSIAPDLKRVKSNQFILDSTELGLDDVTLKELAKHPDEVKAYKNFIRSSAKLYCGEDCNEELLDKDVEGILKLEASLAKLKQPIEFAREPEKIYHPIRFGDLRNLTKFDFYNQILAPIFATLGVNLPQSTVLNIHDLPYFHKTLELLDQIELRLSSVYIGWRVVQKFSQYTSEQFRKLKFQFAKITEGIKQLEPRTRTCVGFVNTKLNMALSRLWVERFFTAQEKADAVKIIDDVQKAYKQIMELNNIFDESTKRKSIYKLEHIVKNIAYPDWLLNNTELDKFYSLTSSEVIKSLLASPKYLEASVEFTKRQIKSEIENFSKPNDFSRKWPIPPAEVNAFYEPTQNSITIPGGILKFPFFAAGRPYSMNYGGIGAVIGHEFTHGFDDEGRQYDVEGNFHSWWAEEDVARFTNRSQCFIDQYSAQVEPQSGLNLNGVNTLGENMADTDGLREAWRAYKNRVAKVGPSPVLAGAQKFNADQLFFITYGHSWCGIYNTQWLRNRVLTNVHAPDFFRVNVVVGNVPEFSETFNCSVQAKMNSQKKCMMW